VLSTGLPYTVAMVLSSAALARAAGRYIAFVSWYFFITQFRARLFPRIARRVQVDHSLDEAVPFEPGRAEAYLDFVRLWIVSLGYARRRLGRAAVPILADFVDGLANCYREAYGVYRRCASTTRRPARAANARFRLVYLVDPHLYCVPSLHVMLVCAAFTSLREAFEKAGRPEEGRAASLEVRSRALEIADAVLYVKQHSVNCVPAALYMTSCLYPGFGPDEARDFMDGMLRDPGLAASRPAILERMKSLYELFMAERAEARDYRDPIVEFLLAYGR